MEYSMEEILESSKYKEICKCFFDLAKNENELKKLKSILYEGKVDNYNFKSKIGCRDNIGIERNRRISMANLFINNPDTFNFFAQNNINLFHGTNANALPRILKYGFLYSEKILNEKNIPILTGEKWSRRKTQRDFVSFTEILDVAEFYSSMSDESNNEDLSFNVIFGVSDSDMSNVRTIPIKSDIPAEICVDKQFPLDNIKCICVPETNVTFVKKIINNDNIKVLGISNIDNEFYYVDDIGEIHIFPEIYQEYKNSIKNNNKKFNNSEVEQIAKSRSILGMKEFLKNINSIIFNHKEKKNGGISK